MWRYLVGGGAVLLLAIAGMFLFRSSAAPGPAVPPAPAALPAPAAETPLPEEAPSASARTREQKRFDRYDKDRDEAVSQDEYLLSRRKAFAKLDTNRDGQLSFEEWAIRTTAKFAGADKDKSGALSRAEFAATAPKPRPTKARCSCPQTKPAADDADD